MVECLSRRTWLSDQQLCALSDAFSDEVCASADGSRLLEGRAGYSNTCSGLFKRHVRQPFTTLLVPVVNASRREEKLVPSDVPKANNASIYNSASLGKNADLSELGARLMCSAVAYSRQSTVPPESTRAPLPSVYCPAPTAAKNVGAPVPGVPRPSAQHPAQLPQSARGTPLSASKAPAGGPAARFLPGATEEGGCCCSSETLAKRGSSGKDGGGTKGRGGRGGDMAGRGLGRWLEGRPVLQRLGPRFCGRCRGVLRVDIPKVGQYVLCLQIIVGRLLHAAEGGAHEGYSTLESRRRTWFRCASIRTRVLVFFRCLLGKPPNACHFHGRYQFKVQA